MPPTPALRRLLMLYAGLIAANLAVWVWALAMLRDHPLLLGTAAVAYGLGLRHAVDADHIAAIDVATRKLMHDGRRPVTVGLFFSLGHSTIVVAATLGVALTAFAMRERFDAFRELGGTLGTAVSAAFLLVLACMNLAILRDVWRRYRRAPGHAPGHAHGGTHTHRPAGFVARLLRPLFRFVSKSWHMYPVGVLFGLGFDTATEIALLAIAAAHASHALPVYAVMLFPALFAAGMTLIDSTDNVLMMHAYGWAMDDPQRKLLYNASITLVSAVVALAVGGIEAAGLLADKLSLTGPVRDGLDAVAQHFGALGYGIVALFVVAWVASILCHRWPRAADTTAR
ncbi:HoxN/HupN/NixA family nickel/cobalt transporter [Burkholderia sp. SIMBA_043]|uniref:HoxN/HupN/NixA family nickel/cobalt transporter n=1 Tax=Burkholderia TaxID=32008 RepID=UPI0005D8A0E9|nr:HoxN/HupN/NixA family nickel/cobalt transporter [Burkholderia vietnamiensis]AJY07615.1 high-affinity nickel transport protein [Burkholderia vietnamiensis LMG 10929]AVR17846.1 HoxN/HupN/NixA family nickel/cobalt transporter [Burkholderia vietnamiensis]KVM52071.1 nickel transporter [Burkholderia vietnamiensis]KVS01731.1 nickel transporter [Burkholderia vietnamiensis]UBI25362.1 HoxN/HupN/NixA family nickel/cobalt transporter [Burkholderia vietnamiensis]